MKKRFIWLYLVLLTMEREEGSGSCFTNPGDTILTTLDSPRGKEKTFWNNL